MSKPLVTLSGPTGSGKTELLWAMQLSGAFRRIVSCTTRSPRPGETHGVDYHFISEEDALETKSNHGFVGHVQYRGAHYGIRVADLEDAYKSSQVPAVIVEPSGVKALRDFGVFDVIPVLVHAPTTLLIERYMSRLVGAMYEKSMVEYDAKRLSAILLEQRDWPTALDAYGDGGWSYVVDNSGDIDQLKTNVGKLAQLACNQHK